MFPQILQNQMLSQVFNNKKIKKRNTDGSLYFIHTTSNITQLVE